MDVRYSELVEALSRQGWRVVERERDDLEWWADEIWTVESEWRPRGFSVYLTWLVDPMYDGDRQPGQAVWAVGTSVQRPKDRSEAEGKPILGLNHWPRALAEFLEGLSRLRGS